MTDARWCAQHNCPSTLCGGSHREFREEQRRRAAPLIAEELRRLADDFASESRFTTAEDTARYESGLPGDPLTPAQAAHLLRARADELDPP